MDQQVLDQILEYYVHERAKPTWQRMRDYLEEKSGLTADESAAARQAFHNEFAKSTRWEDEISLTETGEEMVTRHRVASRS
jgi:hypothetical protein